MRQWEALGLLVFLIALGVSSRWWGPLLDAYGRGLTVGLISGVLLGQMFERRRIMIVQTARDRELAIKLEKITAKLEAKLP
jgi:hypothetical protein